MKKLPLATAFVTIVQSTPQRGTLEQLAPRWDSELEYGRSRLYVITQNFPGRHVAGSGKKYGPTPG
jgi:hypothetical protein